MKFAGVATIEFVLGRCRRVWLEDGDVFAKPFAATVSGETCEWRHSSLSNAGSSDAY
jgi:hypothetical protein